MKHESGMWIEVENIKATDGSSMKSFKIKMTKRPSNVDPPNPQISFDADSEALKDAQYFKKLAKAGVEEQRKVAKEVVTEAIAKTLKQSGKQINTVAPWFIKTKIYYPTDN